MNYYGAQMVCPRPRKFARPDFEAADELLEILLTKEEEPNQIDSSNQFFHGSPPSRVSNPIIHDPRFRDTEMSFSPFVPVPMPPSSARQTFVPNKFSYKQTAMRIEGFDCLSCDRTFNSISTKA